MKLRKTKKPKAYTNISNNSFVGVKWDKQAVEAVNDVAKALLNLTQLFQSQFIKIAAFIKVNSEKESKNAK